METVFQDVRYALRGFRRNPIFTISVLLTLALGVGTTTAVFSVVDRILFRPPDFCSGPVDPDACSDDCCAYPGSYGNARGTGNCASQRMITLDCQLRGFELMIERGHSFRAF